MAVSKEWVAEHQMVAAVAKDNDEKRQKGPGDPLMENKSLVGAQIKKIWGIWAAAINFVGRTGRKPKPCFPQPWSPATFRAIRCNSSQLQTFLVSIREVISGQESRIEGPRVDNNTGSHVEDARKKEDAGGKYRPSPEADRGRDAAKCIQSRSVVGLASLKSILGTAAEAAAPFTSASASIKRTRSAVLTASAVLETALDNWFTSSYRPLVVLGAKLAKLLRGQLP